MSQQKHREFLTDLINGLSEAGFVKINVSDPDLGRVFLDKVGTEKLVDEILSIDDSLPLNVRLPDVGGATLMLLCCNSAWETVYDMGYSSDEVEQRVDAVLNPIVEKYLP